MASSPIQNWFESQINGGTHFSYCLCENEMKDAKVVELLRLLNLITRSLSLKIFNNPSTEDFSSSMIYICCPFFWTIFLLIFLQFLTRSFFVLLGYVPLLG